VKNPPAGYLWLSDLAIFSVPLNTHNPISYKKIINFGNSVIILENKFDEGEVNASSN